MRTRLHDLHVGHGHVERTFRRLPVIAALVLLALNCTQLCRAQGSSSQYGRHFLIPFPDTTRDNVPLSFTMREEARLIIFSESPAKVTITAPGYRRDVTIDPTVSSRISLMVPSPTVPRIYMDLPGITTRDIFEITSDNPICVYCYFVTLAGCEAYTPLPVESWGTEYTLVGQPTTFVKTRFQLNEETEVPYPAPAQAILVAASDATVITITPGRLAASTERRTVTLDAGQAILLETLAREGGTFYSEDFTGSIVRSNKPIGILAGSTRSTLDQTEGVINGNAAKNVLAEWLPPSELYGRSFVYRPSQAAAARYSDEQVLFTTAGASSTTLTPERMSKIVFPSLTAGALVTYHGGNNGYAAALGTTSSDPVQAMLITGEQYNPNGQIDPRTMGTATTFAPAMAELVPRERWAVRARFNAPEHPTFLTHRVLIMADSAADVVLDGGMVSFPAGDLHYRQTEVELLPGDHELRSTNGRFTAIVYGYATGYEGIRPGKTHRKDQEGGSNLLHSTQYEEIPALTYAYPVAGLPDSTMLLLSSREFCDSAVVTLSSANTSALSATAFTVDAIDNVTFTVDTLFAPNGERTAFRIRFRPIDPAKNGSAKITAEGSAGVSRSISYVYNANQLQVGPNPVDLTNVPPSAERLVTIVVRNANDYPVQVTSASLLSGFRGFRIKAPNPFPRILAPGDSAVVTLTFMRVDYDAAFSDALVLAVDCHNDTIPLKARTGNRPAPYLGGHDWGNSWLVASAPCTKNPTDGYPFMVDLYANGTQSVVVASLELIGADAGSFELDRSDPTLSVRTGDILSAGDTNRYRYHQRVIFRPTEERSYRCVLRLITTAGDTVESLLEGVGIESHLTVGDYTFPAVDLTNALAQRGTVTIAARPTRATRIEDLRLVGRGAGRYWLDVADSARLPVVLRPGETWQVGVWYLPMEPGIDSALLVAVGDESRCDDSTGLLLGTAYKLVSRVEDLDLGTRLACREDSAVVTFVNDGNDPIRVITVHAIPEGSIRVDAPSEPLTIPAGGSYRITVRFGGASAEDIDAMIEVTAEDRTGTVTGAFRGHVRGRLVAGTMELAVGRDHHLFPGSTVMVPVELERIDPAGIAPGPVTLRVSYNGSMLALLNGADCAGLFAGTILDGWSCRSHASRGGQFEVTLDPPSPASAIAGPGRVANLVFGGYIGDSIASEIVVELTPESPIPCLGVAARPGRVRLDSICGLGFRLMSLGTAKYALEGNHPNPFNPSTRIDFTLGLDGPTRLVVTDAAGREVARLVDEDLPAGSYSVSWDGADAPSGLYFYHLSSGTWTAIGSMLLVQ